MVSTRSALPTLRHGLLQIRLHLRKHLAKHLRRQHAGVGVVARAVIAREQCERADLGSAAVAEGGGGALGAKSQKIHMDIASKTAHLPTKIILTRGFLFFGWMAGFAACMALIGLIPTVPVFIIAFMRVEGREPWKIVIPMAACVVLLIYVVFDQLLAIQWPPTLAGMLFPALKIIPSV